MLHSAAPPPAEDVTPAEAARNARVGLLLFAVYALLYGGFMAVNAFAPQAMGAVVFAGLNLAVIWGIGLILAAFLLALWYAWLCRRRPHAKREGEA